MSLTVSKLYKKNLVYIPSDFLNDSGITESKNFIIQYDKKTKKISLIPLPENDAFQVQWIESQILILKDALNENSQEIQKLEQSKFSILKSVLKGDI